MSESPRYQPEKSDLDREQERADFRRFAELRSLAFLTGTISYWKDLAVRNPALAKRQYDGFRHQLKYLEDGTVGLRTTETENAIHPAIDELIRLHGAGIDREYPPSPVGMLAVRDREEALWKELVQPELAIEEAQESLRVLSWQLGMLASALKQYDMKAFRNSLTRIDDRFAERAGSVRMAAEALARMWSRDVSSERSLFPREREAWEMLFKDYVRLHSYLWVLDRPKVLEDASGDAILRQLVESTGDHVRDALASIARYEASKRRATGAKKAVATRAARTKSKE